MSPDVSTKRQKFKIFTLCFFKKNQIVKSICTSSDVNAKWQSFVAFTSSFFQIKKISNSREMQPPFCATSPPWGTGRSTIHTSNTSSSQCGGCPRGGGFSPQERQKYSGEYF